MSANTPTANSSYDRSIEPNSDSSEISKDQLVEIVVELEDEVARLRSEVAELQDDEDEIESDADAVEHDDSEVEDDRDEIEEEVEQLRSDIAETRREQAQDRQRLSKVEETIEDAGLDDENPTLSGGETTIQPDDLTPIEQLSRADDVSDVTDSQSVRRAVALFSNLQDWGSKTPKGIVLKPADNPVALLEADRDESLCWKQYYRAAETLEQLSQGSVTFFDSDRHGKMVCLHEQSETYERVVNGELTPSSVGASP